MGSVVFVQVAAPRIIFSLWGNSLKILGDMQKNVFACFVDLEKAYDLVLRENLCVMLQEYGTNGHLFMAIKLLYCLPEIAFVWM